MLIKSCEVNFFTLLVIFLTLFCDPVYVLKRQKSSISQKKLILVIKCPKKLFIVIILLLMLQPAFQLILLTPKRAAGATSGPLAAGASFETCINFLRLKLKFYYTNG